jgi:hypothetical protein
MIKHRKRPSPLFIPVDTNGEADRSMFSDFGVYREVATFFCNAVQYFFCVPGEIGKPVIGKVDISTEFRLMSASMGMPDSQVCVCTHNNRAAFYLFKDGRMTIFLFHTNAFVLLEPVATDFGNLEHSNVSIACDDCFNVAIAFFNGRVRVFSFLVDESPRKLKLLLDFVIPIPPTHIRSNPRAYGLIDVAVQGSYLVTSSTMCRYMCHLQKSSNGVVPIVTKTPGIYNITIYGSMVCGVDCGPDAGVLFEYFGGHEPAVKYYKHVVVPKTHTATFEHTEVMPFVDQDVVKYAYPKDLERSSVRRPTIIGIVHDELHVVLNNGASCEYKTF